MTCNGFRIGVTYASRPSHLLAAAILLSNDLFGRAALWPDVMVPARFASAEILSLFLASRPQVQTCRHTEEELRGCAEARNPSAPCTFVGVLLHSFTPAGAALAAASGPSRFAAGTGRMSPCVTSGSRASVGLYLSWQAVRKKYMLQTHHRVASHAVLAGA